VETFIGFAIRSNNYRLGVNAIGTLKKAELLILCDTTSENGRKDAIKLAKKLRVKIVLSKTFKLEDLTGKEKCKLMAITDKPLATAIINHLDENFTEYRMEEYNG
jgi:hypothetical protein